MSMSLSDRDLWVAFGLKQTITLLSFKSISPDSDGDRWAFIKYIWLELSSLSDINLPDIFHFLSFDIFMQKHSSPHFVTSISLSNF